MRTGSAPRRQGPAFLRDGASPSPAQSRLEHLTAAGRAFATLLRQVRHETRSTTALLMGGFGVSPPNLLRGAARAACTNPMVHVAAGRTADQEHRSAPSVLREFW